MVKIFDKEIRKSRIFMSYLSLIKTNSTCLIFNNYSIIKFSSINRILP